MDRTASRRSLDRDADGQLRAAIEETARRRRVVQAHTNTTGHIGRVAGAKGIYQQQIAAAGLFA